MKKLKLLLLVLLGSLFIVSCEKDGDIIKPPTIDPPVPEYATVSLIFSDLPQAGDIFGIGHCVLIDLGGKGYVSADIADQVTYPFFEWELDTALVREYKSKELSIHISASVIRAGVVIGGVDQLFNFTLVTKPEINEIYIELIPDQ